MGSFEQTALDITILLLMYFDFWVGLISGEHIRFYWKIFNYITKFNGKRKGRNRTAKERSKLWEKGEKIIAVKRKCIIPT